MVGDTILIKDISINGNDELKNASDLSKKLTDNTINALGIDASSRTIWINGQPYGNTYVNIKEDDTIENPIGGEIFNDFTNNVASGEFSHAEGKGTIATNEAEHAEGKYNKSNTNTIHSVGIGTSVNDRKNAEEIYSAGDKYVIGIGGYDGTNSTDDGVKTVQTVVNESINQINISYLKLKELRDASQLVPGQEYRIIDYRCTTQQEGTTSAGNVFDIIVTADNESTLNEEARAINHVFDNSDADYFKDCNLAAWKIWYCLDNDTNRFAWADVTETDGKPNGRGVIYRMVDEWNNDIPYDFKNILYAGSWGYCAYTFNWKNDESDNSCEDLSVTQYAHTNDEGGYHHTYGNIIKPCELRKDANYGYPLKLNACVFLNTESYDAGLYYGCYNNMFENDCHDNILGNVCNGNVFENYCYANTFGNNCYSNTFGNYCYANTFGNNCYINTFGNDCYSNTFGNACCFNSFGNNCTYNFFGNNCTYNSLGNHCNRIYFATNSSVSPTKYDYYKYNHFGDGCTYIVFTGTEIASPSAQVQNYNFAQGLQGDKNNYLYIDGKIGREYDTYISLDSDEIKRESVIANKLDKMIEVTYKELYDLRRDGKLIPGQQYRIIDYRCTTQQEGTTSAGHVFDIIVTADDASTLNEVARAVKHDGDTYFDGCDLNAWKIWYSLDNDTNRFAWADATETDGKLNGKGVIYRMIDEWNNDIPYDFKNILYTGSWGYRAYTFNWINDSSDNSCEDLSVAQYVHTNDERGYSHTYGNVIKPYGKDIHSNSSSSFMLNKCVFLNTESYNNGTYNGCYSNVIGNECHNNTFGNGCYNNTLGNGCNSNTFGNSCSDNSFGCGCYENMVRDYSSFNTFGKECNYIYLGKSCFYNTFGNNCGNIRFTQDSTSEKNKFYENNHFGDGCRGILFEAEQTGGINNYVKNYIFAQGTSSFNTTGDVFLHIPAVRNRNYETYVGFTSSSTKNSDIQIKCLLDIFI